MTMWRWSLGRNSLHIRDGRCHSAPTPVIDPSSLGSLSVRPSSPISLCISVCCCCVNWWRTHKVPSSAMTSSRSDPPPLVWWGNEARQLTHKARHHKGSRGILTSVCSLPHLFFFLLICPVAKSNVFPALQLYSVFFFLQDFLQSLSQASRGTIQEKLRWIFGLYDLNGDGYITKAEMTSV